jgi:glycosyltransferase involved in cell wall biosynthesis
VIIEAAAAGLPTVGSRIYGVVDAVVDGKTGLLHEPADLDGLTGQLERLISNPELRRSLGAEARARAAREFSQSTITSAVLDVYSRLLDGAPRNQTTASDRAAQIAEGSFLVETQGGAK